MTRFLLGILSLVLIALPITAQDNDNGDYRLRDVSVEEYMEGVSAIFDNDWDYLAHHVVIREFRLRYPDIDLAELPFELLIDFQTSVEVGVDFLLSAGEAEWFEGMLRAGLSELQIDTLTEHFTLGNFEITPTALDMDGDGVSELLLEVYDSWSRRRFFAHVDDSIDLLPLPIVGLPSDAVTGSYAEAGQLTVVQVVDLNADGDDEVIIEGDSYGYWSACGDLYVLDWQEDEIVDRTADLFNYCIWFSQQPSLTATFDVSQPDAIQMRETRLDGWNCASERIDTLNMLDNSLASEIIYDNTHWCDLRFASEAFDDALYTSAIEHYEEALLSTDGQLAQYIVARLALAYALNDQLGEAQNTLDSVIPEGQMGDLLIRLDDANDQPIVMCRNAHDFFAEINATRNADPYANPYIWTPENFYFGTEFADLRYFPLPSPSHAGCNYRQFPEFSPTPFPTADVQRPDLLQFIRFDVFNCLQTSDCDDLLAQFDDIFAAPRDYYAGYEDPLLYLRALALEALDRPDEALAQYLALIDTDADSVWARLALLHVTTVQD